MPVRGGEIQGFVIGECDCNDKGSAKRSPTIAWKPPPKAAAIIRSLLGPKAALGQ
jgi:hypothetical protein